MVFRSITIVKRICLTLSAAFVCTTLFKLQYGKIYIGYVYNTMIQMCQVGNKKWKYCFLGLSLSKAKYKTLYNNIQRVNAGSKMCPIEMFWSFMDCKNVRDPLILKGSKFQSFENDLRIIASWYLDWNIWTLSRCNYTRPKTT